MKKILMVLISLLTMQFTSFCQKNLGVFIKGYNEKNYLQYFDSLHQIKKGILTNLLHSYYCYVKFDIGSNSSMINFEFLENPEVPLPVEAKKYLHQLFFSTDGKWEKNLGERFSKTLFFLVHLSNKKETVEENMKSFDKCFEFWLTYMPSKKGIKGFDRKDEVWLNFSF